jgi:hypothetical protein
MMGQTTPQDPAPGGAQPADSGPPPGQAPIKADRDYLSPDDQASYDAFKNKADAGDPIARSIMRDIQVKIDNGKAQDQAKALQDAANAKRDEGKEQRGYDQQLSQVYGGRASQDYARTSQDYAQAQDSRNANVMSVGLLAGAANGTAPSMAAIVGQERTDAANAAAISEAASARGGPGAQAAAMREAMRSGSANQQQNVRDTMAARAGEMATARGQFASATAQARAQDIAQYGQDTAQYGQDIGQEYRYQALGQEQNLGFSGQGVQEDLGKMQANEAAANRSVAVQQAAQARNDAMTAQGIGLVSNVASAGLNAYGSAAGKGKAGASSPKAPPTSTGQGSFPPDAPTPTPDGKARGGAFRGTHPLLVGEEGPEIIVPQAPGYVLTAQQTAALRGVPPTDEQASSLAALYGRGVPLGEAPDTKPIRVPTLSEAMEGLKKLREKVNG